jgi:putative transposase
MLGNTPFDREVAYRNLQQKPLPVAEIEKLRLAFGKGWVLGSAKFCKEMEKAAGRPVTPARRGRPPKPAASQEPLSGIPGAATGIAKEI